MKAPRTELCISLLARALIYDSVSGMNTDISMYPLLLAFILSSLQKGEGLVISDESILLQFQDPDSNMQHLVLEFKEQGSCTAHFIPCWHRHFHHAQGEIPSSENITKEVSH